MKRWLRFVLVTLCLVGGAGAAATAVAERGAVGSVREQVAETHALRERVRAAEGALEKARAARKAETERASKVEVALNAELARVRAKAAHEPAEPKELTEPLNGAARDGDFIAAHAKLALDVAQPIKRELEGGYPFRREQRRRAVVHAIEQLRSPAPNVQSDGIIALWALLGAELSLGQSIELLNEPVLLEGGTRRVHAYQMRVGRVFLGFVSEDGGLAGLHDGEQWVTQLAAAHRAAIVEAIEVLRRRVPPRIVNLPVVVAGAGGPP